jgi:hypothetical protein
MGTGLRGLIESRRFWIAILDLVLSTVLYFVGKYAGASVLEDTKMVIITMQPLFLAIIAAYTIDNTQNIKAQALVETQNIKAQAEFDAVVNKPGVISGLFK